MISVGVFSVLSIPSKCHVDLLKAPDQATGFS